VKCYQTLINVLPENSFRAILPIKVWLLNPWIPKFEIVDPVPKSLSNKNNQKVTAHLVSTKAPTLVKSGEEDDDDARSTGSGTKAGKSAFATRASLSAEAVLVDSDNDKLLPKISKSNLSLDEPSSSLAVIASATVLPASPVPTSTKELMESNEDGNILPAISSPQQHQQQKRNVKKLFPVLARLSAAAAAASAKSAAATATAAAAANRQAIPGSIEGKYLDDIENPFFDEVDPSTLKPPEIVIPFASKIRAAPVVEKVARATFTTSQIRDWYVSTTGVGMNEGQIK